MQCLFALKVLSKLSLFISFFSFFKLVCCCGVSSFPVIFTSHVLSLFPSSYFSPLPVKCSPREVSDGESQTDRKIPRRRKRRRSRVGKDGGVGWCWCDAMSHTLLVSPLKMINVGATRKHMCVSTCPALDFTHSKHTHSPCGATRERLILGSTGKVPELQKMEGGLEREDGWTITRK